MENSNKNLGIISIALQNSASGQIVELFPGPQMISNDAILSCSVAIHFLIVKQYFRGARHETKRK